MPTQTFFHLPKEKQKTLLKAAMHEFTYHSFENASINQIIKEASIPRGSFYMYFHDKEDLYFYLLGKFWRQSFRKLRTFLKENDGDLLQSFEDLYDSMIHLCSKGKNAAFFKNVFLNLRYTTEKKLSLDPSCQKWHSKPPILLDDIDLDQYDIKTDEELRDCIHLLIMITMGSIAYGLTSPDKMEEEKRVYHRRIYYLKYGLYKRKENL